MKELWEQATNQVMMHYNQVPTKTQAHPSNTQGEIHQKEGFITSTNSGHLIKSPPQNQYEHDESMYKHNMYSNRSNCLEIKPYDKRNRLAVHASARSQSSAISERDLYRSPQFSVVATQRK